MYAGCVLYCPLVSHGMTDRRKHGRQTVTLRFPLDTAIVINYQYGCILLLLLVSLNGHFFQVKVGQLIPSSSSPLPVLEPLGISGKEILTGPDFLPVTL